MPELREKAGMNGKGLSGQGVGTCKKLSGPQLGFHDIPTEGVGPQKIHDHAWLGGRSLSA